MKMPSMVKILAFVAGGTQSEDVDVVAMPLRLQLETGLESGGQVASIRRLGGRRGS
jgi:hypothetical protein